MSPRGLVAFDLDGTVVHDLPVAISLATALGYRERALELQEVLSRRESAVGAILEMAGWHRTVDLDALCECLDSSTLAPNAFEAIDLLRSEGFHVALVSITWEFAVAWFASRLKADYWVGTRLGDDGHPRNCWPEDKASWVLAKAIELGVEKSAIFAVGDSSGDLPMLGTAAQGYYVGASLPEGVPNLIHLPSADLLEIAKHILNAS